MGDRWPEGSSRSTDFDRGSKGFISLYFTCFPHKGLWLRILVATIDPLSPGATELIDIATEKILTLSEAAEWLPRRWRGRRTHVSTLYRWTVSGCRGVVLEHIQIGSTRATSHEALQRFF